MSALGQKQTSKHSRMMSALPPKADIGTHSRNVRFVPKADIDPSIPGRAAAHENILHRLNQNIFGRPNFAQQATPIPGMTFSNPTG